MRWWCGGVVIDENCLVGLRCQPQYHSYGRNEHRRSSWTGNATSIPEDCQKNPAVALAFYPTER
jgi:hypothetical protein